LASNLHAQAQGYKIIDLGTLKGTVKSVGYDLNRLGQSNPTAAIATLFSNDHKRTEEFSHSLGGTFAQ
jgi:hypothetical protein